MRPAPALQAGNPWDAPLFKVVDIFCGAGGTSQGFIEACNILNRRVHLTAINHWQIAIDTHTANHPTARHKCTGIDAVNPTSLYSAGELALLWASPECTHHSTARGGKPINDQSRATAWCVCRWAESLRMPVILLENVPEFLTWGPIDDRTGRPIKNRKGEVYRAFKNALESLGYRVEHRLKVCADYGDPTTRKRLFIQAVRGDRPIVWPNRTHVPRKLAAEYPQLKPWVPARDIIDWSIPCPSIFSRKRPLSDKTMARIIAGLGKFGLKDIKDQLTAHIENWKKWVEAGSQGEMPQGFKPFIVPHFGEREGQEPRVHSVDEPLPTATSHGAGALIVPSFILPQFSSGQPRSLDLPAPTVTTTSRGIGFVTPRLIPLKPNPYVVSWDHQSGTGERSIEEPLTTISTKARHGIVQPYLIELRGTSPSHLESTAKSLDEPCGTITTSGKHHALLVPYLINQKGRSDAADIDLPAPTITAHAQHLGIAQPYLVQISHGNGQEADDIANNRRVKSLDEPLSTVCGHGGDIALITQSLLPQQSGGQLRSVDEPAPTVAAAGAIALVEAFIVKYFGTGIAKSVDETLDTVTTKERFGLVTMRAGKEAYLPRIEIVGQVYLLDIGFRMLKPKELALAQGFPADYKFTGNIGEQVKQIGNAVPRHTARAIALAVLSGQADISQFLTEPTEEEVAA